MKLLLATALGFLWALSASAQAADLKCHDYRTNLIVPCDSPYAAVEEYPVNLGDPDPVPERPEPPAKPARVKAAPKPSVRFSVGAGAMLLFQQATKAAPLIRVDGNVGLAKARCGQEGDEWDCAPRLHFLMDFGANPGESPTLADPASIKAIGMRGGISQRPLRDVFLALYCEAGAEALLPPDGEAPIPAQRYGGCGVRLDGFDAGWLNVTVNGDERLDGVPQGTVSVAGALRLHEQKKGESLAGGHVSLVGTALFGLRGSTVIKVGMVVGGGR